MARLAATAVLLLLLSLLAVSSCRFIEAEPETVVAISDEQTQADPSAVPQEKDAAEAVPSLPTVTAVESILRLPSHRRPCLHGFLHRHLRWARNHGLSHRRGAFAGPGDARVVPAFLPEEPAREVEVVAEPDPDSRPHTDVEEVEEKYNKPARGDGDGGEENELVKAWKGEMARRFHAHGLRFQNRHHHHEHAVEKDDSEHQEQQYKEEGAGDTQLQQHVKLFSRHFHNHGDEEQHEDTAAKHYFHHHHEVHDSDNEVDEVEDLARRLSKAIMRRSFSRGGNGIRHHLHHHHHHSEEGRVKKWFKSIIMNRF